MKLEKTVKYIGEVELLTGLSIRGTNNDLNIGGVDSEVIKNPLTGMPYIPGSSIKGKMRSLLELRYGKTKNGDPCRCGRKDCFICKIFGAYKNSKAESAPTRIIVRDANLTAESMELIQKMPLERGSFLEEKAENIINREKGTAGSPRVMERVPAGLKFDLNIVLQIFNDDDEEKLKGYVNEALEALQDSYLGGSGSRGYGSVKITGVWK